MPSSLPSSGFSSDDDLLIIESNSLSRLFKSVSEMSYTSDDSISSSALWGMNYFLGCFLCLRMFSFTEALYVSYNAYTAEYSSHERQRITLAIND